MDSKKNNEEWKKIPLGDLSIGGKGEYGSGARATNYDSSKHRYVRITDINEFGKLKNNSKVSPSIVEEKYLLKKGDIIFARSGSIGKTYLHLEEKEPCIFAGYLIRFKLDPQKILPEYLFLYTKTKRYWSWIKSKASSKTMTLTNINAKEYSQELKIPLPFKNGKPDLNKQKEIVLILKKIEKLKEKRIESSEGSEYYLKSIFYELFSKNKKDFEIKGFLDVFNITTGKLDSNAMEEGGKYPFFTCAQETFKINDFAFDCEALILSGNNAAGKYSVKHYIGKFNAYQRTYILTLKDSGDNFRYLLFVLTNKLEELRKISIGTNTKYLTLGLLKDIKIPIPQTKLQEKFALIVKEIEKLKEKQNKSKIEMDELFNSLMQKAFSGELI